MKSARPLQANDPLLTQKRMRVAAGTQPRGNALPQIISEYQMSVLVCHCTHLEVPNSTTEV